MNAKLFKNLGLAALGLLSLLFLYQGCTTKIPTLSAMKSYPSSCQPLLLNAFESLDNLSSSNPSGSSTITANLTLSPLHVTQGVSSLDIDIYNPPLASPGVVYNWNDQILYDTLTPPQPTTWANFTQAIADVYIDPSVIAGATYHSLNLYAKASSGNYQSLCSNQPSITSGQQSITWVIDSIPSGATLTVIFLILNANTTNGSGNIYLDNLRLVYKECPTPTPIP